MLTPWALNQKRIKKWLALALYQYGDLRSSAFLHATAASEVEDIRRVGLRRPVVVAPLGVDSPAAECDAKALRRGEPRIALFVSRVHPKKGLFNLVDAWANVRPSGWKMMIAGPDENGHAADVMARARAAGVENDFELIGSVFGKEKEALYAKADLFVLPTYSENFGVVVIEALAQGCPVITTKGAPWNELLGRSEPMDSKPFIVSGGQCSETERKQPFTAYGLQHTDFAANGRCGWWIEIGVEPLAQALKEATSLADAEREAMGRNGRALVQAKYSWSIIARKMMGAYQAALDGQRDQIAP
jgi:glycosyltransferase involved in cell wall biosynthesis